MEVGIIGLGEVGQIAAKHLLHKTAHNLSVYDPDKRTCKELHGVHICTSGAELCERCQLIILALDSASDLTALCNAIIRFVQSGQLFVDLTDTSPALAHTIANGMRRFGALYVDCGIFGAKGLEEPCILFAGGSREAFGLAQPVLRCFARNCHYMGPSGRGKAVRLFCRTLTAQIQQAVEDTAYLAHSFGIPSEEFMEALETFPEVANPLGMLQGEPPAFSLGELAEDVELVAEMERRMLHKPNTRRKKRL